MSIPNPNPTVFFAGLGAMGHGTATHLLRSGFPITGYDLQPLSMLKQGGASANTPREAAKDADMMIVVVANHQQATLLLFDPVTGAVEGLKGGATVIARSTVAPACIVEVSERLREMGGDDVRLVDCPVSGGVARAAQGTLSLFSLGDEEALFAPHVQSILACLSDTKKLHHVPGGLGARQQSETYPSDLRGRAHCCRERGHGLRCPGGVRYKARV